MTAEKAIEILSDVGDINRCCSLLKKLCYGASDEAMPIIPRYEFLQALSVAINALKRTSWVPCSERLPEDGNTYLVTIEYKGEVIGVDAASYSPVEGYIDKHWDTFNDWKEDDDSCYHVTAWMPLQEPYKKEAEGNAIKVWLDG